MAALIALAAAPSLGARVLAQGESRTAGAPQRSAGPDTTPPVTPRDTGPRLVSGRIVRPDADGVHPVGGVRVLIHRVGSDTAAPLDSMRTRRDGSFTFHYRPFGDPNAIYFVSASYGGIAYFSEPLRSPRVTGDDAEITVFDTTSAPVPLHVRGRHLIIASPEADGSREMMEVYELSNDTTVTRVSPDDAHPTWTALLPPGAIGFSVGQSDISPRAVRDAGGRVEVVAPIAPGLKQLSFSYRVPAKDFPLSIPMTKPVSVLEVLTEDPRATVSAPNLKAEAAVAIEGRKFARYVGQNEPADAVLRVDSPTSGAPSHQQRYLAILAIALGVAMLGALTFVFARRRAPRIAIVGHPAETPADGDAERLAREIASLDAQFEQQAEPSSDARAEYEQRRDALKRSLARALDARRTRA